MTPRMQGLVRQAQAPIKKPALGDEGSGEEDDDEEVAEQSPQYFQGFDEDEEREGGGPWPEPPQIALRVARAEARAPRAGVVS
jgi:hypothetical protein